MTLWSTIGAELVALVIIFWFLGRYVAPPIKRMMQRTQSEIQGQFDAAEQAKARRAEAERRYDEAVSEARSEAATIRDNARGDAQRIGEEMRARADAEVERIRARGQEQLALARAGMVRELRAVLGSSAVSAADELVRSRLADDEARAATVDRFLDELEGMARQDGGGGFIGAAGLSGAGRSGGNP
jgi:F-type H+-transporting ATPase subunit delta